MTKYNDIRNIRVLAFLDAYERQECLWNPALDSYKNKADRDEAYLRIIKELNIPSLNVQDVKLKVKGIRTTYTKELRLLTKYREQGKSYKPKLFWFNKANAFLRNVCVSRHKQSFFPKEEDNSSQNDSKQCAIEYISDDEEMVENETEEDVNNTLEPASTHSHSGTPVDFKTFVHVVDQAENPLESDRDSNPIEVSYMDSSNIVAAPNGGHQSTQASPCKAEEFDMFCRSVAAQLRSIPDSYSRSVAKLKIQQILFEAETGHYKNSPCITIPIVQQVNSI